MREIQKAGRTTHEDVSIGDSRRKIYEAFIWEVS